MIKFNFNICWNVCTWQEAQHTCCAAKKYVQHSLFAKKLQNVNLVRLCFVNTDGDSWLNSVLFWILKAVYGLLATPDSICYHNRKRVPKVTRKVTSNSGFVHPEEFHTYTNET